MSQNRGPKEFLELLRKKENLIEIPMSPEEANRVYAGDPRAQYLIDNAKARNGKPLSYPNELFKEITLILPAEERTRVQTEIAFGELLIRDVNATLQKAEEGYLGYVIIVNRGLTSLFFHISKLLLARSATKGYLERAYKVQLSPIADYQVVIDSILVLLRRYREGGIPEPAFMQPQILLDEPRRNLLIHLQANSVSFVIAHELGHYLCGHMGQSQTKEHEFEADVAAMSILLNKAHKFKDDRMITNAVAGSLLALSYVEMIEKSSGVSAVFHPLAHERIDKIRKVFDLHEAYYEIANPLMEMVRGICGRLFDNGV